METRSRIILVIFFSLICSAIFVFSFPQPVSAATIVVDTLEDQLDGPISPNTECSLREAIWNANHNDKSQAGCDAGTGNDTILLPKGTYTLDRPGYEDANEFGDLDIWGNLIINGAGARSTIIQAGTESPVDGLCKSCVDRVFHTLNDSDIVTLNDVSIRYGKAQDGTKTTSSGNGGGILNEGTMTLNDCAVYHNRSGNGYDNPAGDGGSGGKGGGIYTNGPLTLEGSKVDSNLSGKGGDGGDGGRGWFGGFGGGIYMIDIFPLSISNSIITENKTGDGGRGGDKSGGEGGNGGPSGRGGGIYCVYCTLSITHSDVISNETGEGGDGGDVISGDHNGGRGAYSGEGAGAYISEGHGPFTQTDSTFEDNQTGAGGSGGHVPFGSGGTEGNPGFPGQGGGLCLTDSQITNITGSTFSGNVASNGGAIANLGGSTAILYNSTVSGNGAFNDGGGIINQGSATLALTFVTLINNVAINDGGGFLYTDPLTLTNTIVANNYSVTTDNDDCYGSPTSMGYNLIGVHNSPDCSFTPLVSDLVGTVSSPLDPGLDGLLSNHGGPTETHAVNPGSPVTNQIPTGVNGCIPGIVTDQRGVIRIGKCDIGAYELKFFTYLPLIMR